MESAVTAVFEVLNFGAIIILVVLGLGVIAGMMGIFNFAHGEFVLLGAYWVYLFDEWKLPVWLGMLTAPAVVAADRRLAVAAGGATVLIEDPSPLPLSATRYLARTASAYSRRARSVTGPPFRVLVW